jgi:bifunctional UDP-N-acetylglucosamine pyrophosphorylase/glucosamine-1-phosphate N-acetyltransferase
MAEAEKILWKRKACELMLNGTTLKSPENIFISPDVEIGQESVIYPGVVIEGNSQIGRNVYIGQYSYLKDVIIEDSVHIEGCAFISGKHIKKGTLIEFNKKVT